MFGNSMKLFGGVAEFSGLLCAPDLRALPYTRHSGTVDLGDFEAFLNEIGVPTPGSNLFWGVFGMG